MRYVLWAIVAVLFVAVVMAGQVWFSKPIDVDQPQGPSGGASTGTVGSFATRSGPAAHPATSFSLAPGLRRQAASQARSLETVLRHCQNITRNIKGPGMDARRRAALRRYEGKLLLARWIDTAPQLYRESLRQWIRNKQYAAVATAAFSPRRRERAAAIDKLNLIGDRCSTWLLDSLLVDGSRYVRLKALNVFWTRRPDALGVKLLFWMATCTGYAPFDLASGRYGWHVPAAAALSRWQVEFHGKSVTAVGGSRTVINFSDQHRACQILLRWHPRSLGKWLVKALTYGMPDVGASDYVVNFSHSARFFIQNWNNYRSLFEMAPPPAAASYLLGFLEGPENGMNPSIILGRQYYSNAFTEVLWLLLVDEHLNPTHFGLVTVSQGASHAPRVKRFIYAGQQALAIRRIKIWCNEHGIEAASAAAPPPNGAVSSPVIWAGVVKQWPGLFSLKCGMINWYRWALRRPAKSQKKILTWGARGSVILDVSLAFSQEGRSQLYAAYALPPPNGAAEMRALAHLIDGQSQAASLAAMNLFWKRRPDAVIVRALWRRATLREIPPWLPKRAGSPLTWTLHFRRRKLIIYKQIQGVTPDHTGTAIPSNSRRASYILVRWRPRGIQSRLITAAKLLAHSDIGPFSHAYGPEGRVGQNMILVSRCGTDARLVPYLLADLQIKKPVAATFGFAGQMFYPDEITDPLVILCNLAGRRPEQFGLHRFPPNLPAQPLEWDFTNKADESVSVVAMEKYWAARGIYAAKIK